MHSAAADCIIGIYKSPELLAHPTLGIAVRTADLLPVLEDLGNLLDRSHLLLTTSSRSVITSALDVLKAAGLSSAGELDVLQS